MALTLEETRTFGRNVEEYREAKRLLLKKWTSNCTGLLTLEAVKDGWPESLAGILQSAFTFLQEHGLINFGVNLRSPEPLAAEPAPASAPSEAEQGDAAAAAKIPSKADIVARLYAILRTADFAVMTEKKIRAQLESDTGCDMVPYKALVRKHVLHVVGHQDERESLEPLPVSDDEGAAGADASGDSKKAGKAGQEGKAAKHSLEKAKEPPHVVVVGAGLAGLVAATMLQRNGCKVTVMEAQQQAGGRLAKLFPLAAAAAAAIGPGESASAAVAPGAIHSGALPDAALGALGSVSLRLPALLLPAAEGQIDTSKARMDQGEEEEQRWPAGALALRTLCSQLGIVPLPLAVNASGDGGDGAAAENGDAGGNAGALLVHRPRLYVRSYSEEVAGVSAVASEVQDEAERLLVDLLTAIRRRLDEQDKLGEHRRNGHSAAKTASSASSPHSVASVPLAASLAEELEAEIGRRVGQSPGTAGAAAQPSATASIGAGVKRPSEGEGAATAGGTEASEAADGANRPSKRTRGDHDGEADKEAEAGAVSSGSVGPGGAADAGSAPADSEAAVAGAKCVADSSGETGQEGDRAPTPSRPELPDAGAVAPEGRIRQEVLHVLRNHLMPLLELQLGGPLHKVPPSQLRLVHPGPLLATLPQPAPLETAALLQPRFGLLPVSGARRIVEALAAGLDLRTGVAVTAVAVMAEGGVKVTTESAGVIKATAVVMAVPHSVLQSGAISLDAPPPYRTSAAARVGGGGAVSLSLRLPAGADLAPLCGGGSTIAPNTNELRPFFVVSATGVASAAAAAAPCGGQPGAGLGFLFCPVGRASTADAEEGGEVNGSEATLPLLVAHVTAGSSAKPPMEMSDEDLRRHVVAALQAAAAASVGAAADEEGDQPNGARAAPLPEQLEPVSCHVVRWGGPAAAAGPGSGRATAAAARGGACAHLALRGHPRDMALLAGPLKGRLFFAGEHTAPDQLSHGLLAALVGSGLREAARVLKAVKSGGSTAAAGHTKAAAAAGPGALEVGDEPPLQSLITAAEAGAKAAAAAAEAAKTGLKAGKKVGGGEAKAKGRSAQVLASDSESEGEEEDGDDDDDVATAKRRKKVRVTKDGGGPLRGKDSDWGKGKTEKAVMATGAKGKGREKAKEKEALEDEGESGSAGGSGSEEEEDSVEDEDVDEEEEEEDAKKRGRSKAAVKQQKTRKPAGKVKRGGEEDNGDEGQDDEEADARSDKKKKKRKRGGGGSDDEGSSEPEEEDEADAAAKRSKAGRRSEREKEREKERKEDAVQLGLLDKQKRQQALAKLQAERKDVKVVYKAMMAASNGNLGPLREQMSSCAGLDAKLVMLQALQKSSLQVLQMLANDWVVLAWLKDWLLELCDDSSAEHLALMELRLLERLPLSGEALAAALAAAAAAAAAAAEEGGPDGGSQDGAAGGLGDGSHPVRALLAAVRERCATHRSKDVKRMAAQVATAWERRAASAASAGRAGPASASGAGPHPAATAPRPPLFNPMNLVSLRTTPPSSLAAAVPAIAGTSSGGRPPQPPRPPPPPPGGPRPTGSDAGGGSRLTPPSSGVNGAASSEAASGPSGGSAGDPGPPPPPPPPPPAVLRLDPALEARLMAAKAAAEAARQEAALAAQRRAEVQQEAQAAGGSRGASKPEIDTFEDYRRIERGGGDSGGDGSGKQKDASGSGSSGKHKSSGGAGSGGGLGLAEMKAAVVDFIKQQLKRHHKAGTISSSDFRLIQERASNKVLETITEASAAAAHGHGGRDRDLLGSKRREKISHLVEQYVKKAAAQKQQPHQPGAGGVGREQAMAVAGAGPAALPE